MIVLVAAFAELAYAVVNVSAMPVYIVDNARLDRVWVGIIGSAYLVMEGVLKSPLGALSDRIGRRALMLTGPIISTCTALLTPWVHNPYGLVGLRVLDGVGAAALWPAAFSLIGDYVPEDRRATGMSLFNVAYILGIAFGPALGGNINHWAYRYLHFSVAASKEASFYVAALLFAITAILAMIFVPRGKPQTSTEAAGDHAGEAPPSFAAFVQMLAKMPMTLLLTFTIFLGVGFVMLYVKLFALEPGGPFHMSEAGFGDTLIIPALLIGLLSVPLGTLGDRIGKVPAVRIGIGLCAGAFWLLLLYPNQWTLIGLGTLIGVGFVIAFPAWMALVSATCEANERGAVIGAVATAQGLGAILGAASSGVLYRLPAFKLGTIQVPPHGVPFLACGVMLTISFVLALTSIHGSKPGVTTAT